MAGEDGESCVVRGGGGGVEFKERMNEWME